MSKSSFIQTILFFLLFVTIPNLTFGQSTDYSKIFNRWDEAVEWINENKSWMKELCDEYDVDYEMATTIVFPELLRYSRYRNVLETLANKALYIQFGSEYSNFSVGVFQIKPSFVEDLLFSNELSKGKLYDILNIKEDYDDDTELREEIVYALQSEKSAFRFVIAFMKICEKRYKIEDFDEYEKVVFMSTVYNAGLKTKQEDVSDIASEKHFNDRLITDQYYSYSDVALWYYKFYRSGKKFIIV